MNCICDHFQLHCHTLSLSVDQVWALSPCVQTILWLTILWLFNIQTDVNKYDCTLGLCKHHRRISQCWKLVLGTKNPLVHQGVEPASAASWTYHSTNWATPCPAKVPELWRSRMCHWGTVRRSAGRTWPKEHYLQKQPVIQSKYWLSTASPQTTSCFQPKMDLVSLKPVSYTHLTLPTSSEV